MLMRGKTKKKLVKNAVTMQIHITIQIYIYSLDIKQC